MVAGNYLCRMELTFSLDTIGQAARQFREALKGRTVFAFHGQMGAGKTTFIHALCADLGVKDVVGSPTFSLVNEYRYDCEGTARPLFHMDLYRLKDEEEAVRAGLEDLLYSGHICLAEWPEKAPGIFPPGTVQVYMDLLNNGDRRIKISD